MNIVLSVLILVGLGPTAVSQHLTAQVAVDDTDAMSLAVEYFDPGHERALTANSRETGFMFDVLDQIHRAVPETRRLHRVIQGDATTHVFNSIIMQSPSIPQKEIKRIVAAVAAGTPMCTVRTAGSTPASSDCDYHVDESTPWLFSHGIFMIRTITSGNYTIVYFRGELCDPYGLLAAIRREPEYKKVMRGLEMEVLSSEHAGEDETSIKFESKPSDPTFTSTFRLRFTYATGDCPSGCGFHHSWIVECVPVVQVGGRSTVSVHLIEEVGDPLPDGVRTCLKCGLCGQ